MKKIVLILLICLIFAGTVIVCFKGFNVGLPYKSNINISVYVGKKIEDILIILKLFFSFL